MDSNSSPQNATVLRYWQLIELFALPSVPPAGRGDARVFPVQDEEDLPWNGGGGGRFAIGRRARRYRCYGGVFPIGQMSRLMQDVLPAPDGIFYGDLGRGESALFSFEVTAEGQPVPETLVLSSAPWALARTLETGDLHGDWIDEFALADEWAQALFERLFPAKPWTAPRASHEHPHGITYAALMRFGETLIRRLRIPRQLLENRPPRVRVQALSATDTHDQTPFINSPFLRPLENARRAVAQDVPSGLLAPYLARQAPGKRVDSLTHNAHCDRLLGVRRMPEACWPAPADHSLNRAQQLAVNAVHHHLQEAGVFGIEGPPGTGKTTLLRDLVASILLERAKALAKLTTPDAGFVTHHWLLVDGTLQRFWEPLPALAGHEIVVTSSNNGAVENVAKALPTAGVVDPDWLTGTEYFPRIARAVTRNDTSWGLIAAVLGRRSNCSRFLERFWLQESEESPDGSADSFRDVLTESAPPPAWRKAVSRFEQALHTERQYRRSAEHAERKRTHEEGTIVSAEEELSRPCSDPDWHRARTHVFRETLHLHRAFILNNRQRFLDNLDLFAALLTGGVSPDIPSTAAQALWTTFFLAVPIVSTTLAAFDRLFQALATSTLGWVFLDEAGQVAAHHAVPALMRARRLIAVGDPRQLEPIVTAPECLRHLLRAHLRVPEAHEPAHHSVQQAVNHLTPMGTWGTASGQSRAERPWLGMPLRVHRRCEGPIFDIANAMAYDGIMIQGTKSTEYDLPESIWIDVPMGPRGRGNLVTEEITALEKLIDRLARTDGSAHRSLFILSPFRQVVSAIRASRAAHLAPHVGTVHTTQGREADIVVLVLGGNHFTRRWVTARPNLLNVAVTRARKRLYVIGDRARWGALPHARVIAQRLSICPADELETRFAPTNVVPLGHTHPGRDPETADQRHTAP